MKGVAILCKTAKLHVWGPYWTPSVQLDQRVQFLMMRIQYGLGVALDQCCSKHSWVNRHRHFGLSEFSVYMSQAATSMLRDYTGDSCIWCRGSVFVWQCSFISRLVTRSQRANERFNSMDSTWLLGYQNFTVYLQHQLLQDREKYRLTEHWGCFSEETTKLITKAWQP